MEEQQKLMEAIEVKLGEHGLLDEAGDFRTALGHVMKTNSRFRQEMVQAAADGMVRRLRAEAKKYKGNLGGWRGEVSAGFSKRELDSFAKMAQGEMTRAVDSILQKLMA